MKIPKTVKKQSITNPFRPKTGVPREHSVCKLSWKEFEIERGETVTRVAIDCDDHEEFFEFINLNIPEEHRHYCSYKELWTVDKQHKDLIKEKVQEFFYEVKTEFRKW